MAMYRMVLVPSWIERTALAMPLSRGSYTVGRSPKCDIVITHRSVSRRHARLSLNDSELLVTDLNSKYGTYVDERRIESCSVRVGQVICFGVAPYRVSLDGADAPIAGEGDDDETSKRYHADLHADTSLLTASQQRVYDLLLEGDAEAVIAAKLNLSVHTVHSHVKAIYTRHDVHSRAELLARSIKSQRR